jgi:outer membrane lipoprotein-sorting protein
MRPLVLCALLSTGCTPLIANMVAHHTASAQLAVEGFHGTLTERHMLTGDPDGALVKDVWYGRLSKVRVEVVSPAALAGDTFVYDGAQVSMWWPRLNFGMRVKGVPAPTPNDWHALVRSQTRTAMHRYDFARLGEGKVAGRSADGWHAGPRDEAPYRYAYESWVDQQSVFPLRIELFEAPGRSWYAMEYDAIDFETAVPAAAFDFHFPEAATVLEWDLSEEGRPLEEARQTAGFPLLVPRGHRVEKVLTDARVVPAATLVMDERPQWASLTEVRQLVPTVPPTGKRVRVGDADGYLNFVGSYTTLTWVKQGIALTLVSNLDYTDVLELAGSVE